MLFGFTAVLSLGGQRCFQMVIIPLVVYECISLAAICLFALLNLKYTWWLTSTKWYPPNLSAKMQTAYVVRQEKKEAFEQQFTGDVQMILSYENSKFAVYLSDRNFVNMP